jgi:hypothetical protein
MKDADAARMLSIKRSVIALWRHLGVLPVGEFRRRRAKRGRTSFPPLEKRCVPFLGPCGASRR